MQFNYKVFTTKASQHSTEYKQIHQQNHPIRGAKDTENTKA
jgi:hypothetical protein